jgi:hypothetical protein
MSGLDNCTPCSRNLWRKAAGSTRATPTPVSLASAAAVPAACPNVMITRVNRQLEAAWALIPAAREAINKLAQPLGIKHLKGTPYAEATPVVPPSPPP